MADIFLSYGHADRAQAEALALLVWVRKFARAMLETSTSASKERG